MKSVDGIYNPDEYTELDFERQKKAVLQYIELLLKLHKLQKMVATVL